MKTELNDETLTAYALGELDAAETKAIKKLLANDEAARNTLDEIRATVVITQAAFAESAHDLALSEKQRGEVQTLAANTRRSFSLTRVSLALAAGLAVLFGGATMYMGGLSSLRDAMRPAMSTRIIMTKAANDYSGVTPTETRRPEITNLRTGLQHEAPQRATAQAAPVAGSALSDGKSVGAPVSSSLGVPPPNRQWGDLTNEERLQEIQGGVPEIEQLKATGYSGDSQTAPDVGYKAKPEILALKKPELGKSVAAGRPGLRTRSFGVTDIDRLASIGYADPRKEMPRPQEWGYSFQPQSPAKAPSAEAYQRIVDSGFVRVADQPLSTFSIDVDTASYANMRRFLEQGQLPPPDAVRVEELINYFDYAYPAPTDGTPFAAHFEAAACPWAPEHTLVRIGLKGREIPRAERPATNLVFLIDVSGSMQPENKLPLVKKSMAMLTRQLDERDRVSIVTYASGVNLALPPTNASRQEEILRTIENLGAGGSTNGAGGIQLAYESARKNFLPGGVNRVILATDGDFNVGVSDNDSLLQLIQNEAKSGVFLSVFGFGMGNLKDDKLELLADKGNGVYGYIDSESEARRVFVEKISGTLVTIAKDVKIQVEFNPANVGAYRLIGYENRALAAQDFNDDRKDAGEIGAGHTVTALYELAPAGVLLPAYGAVHPLRYQAPVTPVAPAPVAASIGAPPADAGHADELLLVKLRYKEPEGAESKLLEFPLKDSFKDTLSPDLKFASAVAAFGKLLRGNPLGTALTYDGMMQLAQAGLAASHDPRRSEMIHLMLQARPLIEVNNPQVDPSRYQPVQ